MSKGLISNPLDVLLPFQRRYVDDASRFKLWNASRQIGKSFATAGEETLDCVANAATSAGWVVMSAGERQVVEFMDKVQTWAQAFGSALEGYDEFRDSPQALIKRAEAVFPGGVKIIGVPANPNTARGYSRNVHLDEFAFHEKPDDIWRALYPSITNPLRKQKLKIRVTSTPNGKGNKFFDLVDGAPGNGWSLHRTSIHDAAADYHAAGIPFDVEELRRGLDDPEGWAQEYELEFLDSAGVLLPYELLALAESADCLEHKSLDDFGAAPLPLVMGVDFARSRDLSVAWTLAVAGPVGLTFEVLIMENMSTPDQAELLRPRIKHCRRVALDYTGPGVGLGDYLAKDFGEYDPKAHKFGKVELCKFTNALKLEIFPLLRRDMEAGNVKIPESRAIREDLHSVYRVALKGGGVTYRAPHTKDGHADRCTALALGNRARGNLGGGGGAFARVKARGGRSDRFARGMRARRERRVAA